MLLDELKPQPRLVFVWENLLAILEDKYKAKEARALRQHRWGAALRCWGVRQDMRSWLIYLSWNRSMPVDILTTHPEGYAAALERWLEASNYPYNQILCHPAGLAEFSYEVLPGRPDIFVIYHAEAHRPFLFGTKGRMIAGPEAI